jgi:hypothetical protein
VPLIYTARLGPIERAKNDLALRIRRGIYEVFMQECAPGPQSRVADFGVTGQSDHPAHYFFELLYPYRERLTAIGQAAEDARWYPEHFPGITFLEADLRELPLPDDYFEAGICNAVVEHAGRREQQAALVREVCRVCRSVLFTTPNKHFPIELHSFLPFVHWLPDSTFRAILDWLGLKSLACVENLNPLDRQSFLGLFPPERDNRILNMGLGPLQTNLVGVSRAVAGPSERERDMGASIAGASG